MTERKLESAENNIKKLNDEKAQLEALKQEQATKPREPDYFGGLRRREPDRPEPRIDEKEKEKPEEPKKTKGKPEHKEPREPRTMATSPSSKKPRTLKTPQRKAPLLKPESAFAISSAGILHVYDQIIDTLQLGIKAGNVDVPEGVLSLIMFADLLHGGAYAVGIDQRPHHMADPTSSQYYVNGLIQSDASQGFLGWLASVLGITNVGPYVQEIFEDANVPHVFPKMLSDDAYATILTLAAHSANTEIFKTLGTGITTYVEAAKQTVQTVGEAAEVGTKALTPLLKLIQAGVTLA